MMARSTQLTIFCKKTATVLVRQSKTEEARDVGLRFAPLWNVRNDRLRAEFIDNEDGCPVHRRTLSGVADRKIELYFQASNLLLLETNTCSPSSPFQPTALMLRFGWARTKCLRWVVNCMENPICAVRKRSPMIRQSCGWRRCLCSL